MSLDDQIKWNRQHAAQKMDEKPSGFLEAIVRGGSWQIPAGRALDIAAGKGRNALFLAENGFEVVAIDISPVALEQLRQRAEERSLLVSCEYADLETIELPKEGYDLIVNFNYLQRSLVPQIKSAVKPGGYVIFETYLLDQQALGHPKNPAYLLGHNELLGWFREFRVLWYREGKFREDEESAFRAGIFAQKPT